MRLDRRVLFRRKSLQKLHDQKAFEIRLDRRRNKDDMMLAKPKKEGTTWHSLRKPVGRWSATE
jgi:hypothetical protein